MTTVGHIDKLLPSEGKHHTFEPCRVRHFFVILQRHARAETVTRLHLPE